jgi:gliding motility-associated-like protein
MFYKLVAWLIGITGVLSFSAVRAQIQSCPANINFSARDLSFWSAQTGLVNGPSHAYPAPNNGVSFVPEYTIATTGIRVISTSGTDLYGGFSTIPNINGYAYGYSVQLGSTATSFDLHTTAQNPGGFTRSVTYLINVPAGPTTVPYTMTYAYAMVLENGTHNSNEQPMFKATLIANGNVIDCASPHYYLPTFNNATGGGGTGATLDTAAALANGFTNSPVLFLSHSGAQGNTGILLRDVWTKGWTEVTFDLSPYRGQNVTLTFEADNCLPGAHFAYAYVALRNSCAGLQISGDTTACSNANAMYSVPALAGATYNWTVPAGWSINSGNNTNIIHVTPGAAGGSITVNEVNSCANLNDTLAVKVTPPTVAGQILSNAEVCSGTNNTQLTLNGSVGNILKWVSSTDGTNWTNIPTSGASYSAQNLTQTTTFRAIVQNGSACTIDTSVAATIVVDAKNVGGVLNPQNSSVCLGQTTNSVFDLTGNKGAVVNWQRSNNNVNWINFAPPKNDSTYSTSGINADIYYRVIVKSGVCPADTSSIASVHFINVPFPSATIDPDSTSICYGKSAQLHATITAGTSYTWSHANTLTNQGNGNVISLPFTIQPTATPTSTTRYVLTVSNLGCPNSLTDTFLVHVSPRIVVFAGNDTNVVANQPVQLHATVSDPTANQFVWSPGTGLSATNIQNPVATLNPSIVDEGITYVVRATNPQGCYGEDAISIRVFKTGPDIFVPTAFTPNGDGRNDVLRPILVGIKQLNFFRIYNRWGQLVFSTSESGKGWDGTISGQQQSTANFVFLAEAVDYTGKIIFKKGNVTLIR